MQENDPLSWLEGTEVDPVAETITQASDAYASSQADLARCLGMQPLALTQWRGGKRTSSQATIRRMAKELLQKSDELRDYSLKSEGLAGAKKKRVPAAK